ncbi:GNAT family N-acetyltransferase [Candidatus Thorarchaeota archaeon]|nr:MAG: GNAT family N-acetyltransferase [Candidatus Thorarchaeota archaeon]
MSKYRELKIGNHTFIIIDDPSNGDIERVYTSVEDDKRRQTHGEYNKPGIEINLVLRDSQGNVQGGVIASTVFRVMHLEVLWVAEQHRRQGYGAQLVLGAEQIGLENGCLASQTWTFSFQGPNFYPAIGYEPIGVYDGYPNGITEHAFIKRLRGHQGASIKKIISIPDSRGFYLDTDVTEENAKILHQGLHQHVVMHVGDGYKGTKIKLVIRDQSGGFVGGLSAWTTLQNLIFDYIWIEERFRGKGLGKILMLEMERIAKESGCTASQAYSFSFQSPGFFEKMGYKVLGISNGYPPPTTELYLIKKYN